MAIDILFRIIFDWTILSTRLICSGEHDFGKQIPKFNAIIFLLKIIWIDLVESFVEISKEEQNLLYSWNHPWL